MIPTQTLDYAPPARAKYGWQLAGLIGVVVLFALAVGPGWMFAETAFDRVEQWRAERVAWDFSEDRTARADPPLLDLPALDDEADEFGYKVAGEALSPSSQSGCMRMAFDLPLSPTIAEPFLNERRDTAGREYIASVALVEACSVHQAICLSGAVIDPSGLAEEHRVVSNFANCVPLRDGRWQIRASGSPLHHANGWGGSDITHVARPSLKVWPGVPDADDPSRFAFPISLGERDGEIAGTLLASGDVAFETVWNEEVELK